MAKEGTRPIQRAFALAAICVLALLVAARFVHTLGAGRELPYWQDSLEQFDSLIKNGRMVIQKDRWVSWNPTSAQSVAHPSYEIQMKCRWIGQIFLSIGQTETYLLFDDVKNIVPHKPFTLQLDQKEGQLSLRLKDDDQVLRQVPVVPESTADLKIRAGQSDFVIQWVRLRDGDAGPVLAKETFGPDFTFSRILPVGLLLLVLFLGLRWIDCRFWMKLFRQDRQTLHFTFLTAWLPLAFGYLLLNQSTIENLLDNLVLATVAFRVFLVFSAGRGKKSLWVDRRGWLWFAAGMGPGIYLLTTYGLRGGALKGSLGVVSGVLVLIGISLMWVRLIQIGRKAETLSPLRLGAWSWGFPAVGNMVLFFQDDEDPALLLLGYFLLMFFLTALRILMHVRKELRYAQPAALVLFLLVVAAAEGALRQSDYAARFLPMNIGRDFETNELLFWAPKDLFARATPDQPVDDFQVQKVQFRSGEPTVRKPEGTYRILTLGGSNTWGQWLDDPEKTWSGRLEEELTRRLPGRSYEVINAGVKGYNSFQLLVLYRSYLEKYDPDLVCLYVNINDRAANERKGMYTYRELYDLRTEEPWENVLQRTGLKADSGKPRWVAGVQRFFQSFALYNGLTKGILAFRETPVGRAMDPQVAKSLNPIDDYKANLQEFVERTRNQGRQLILADEFTFFGDDMEKKPDLFQQAMAEVAQENKALHFPAHDYLADHFKRSTLVFPWDPVHLNETGHQALAEGFADFIIRNIHPDQPIDISMR